MQEKEEGEGGFTCGVVSTRALVRVIPKEESIYFYYRINLADQQPFACVLHLPRSSTR